MSLRPRAILAPLLLVLAVVAGASVVLAGTEETPVEARLMLDDFEHPMPAERYGFLDHTVPVRERGELAWERRPCRRSHAEGHCMALRYEFDRKRPQRIDFRVHLGAVDARRFDHLEIWVRGDAAAGFSEALKVGFRRPKPGGRGLVEDGTHVVTKIDEDWQRILVPLTRLSGITEWTNVTDFFVALESRRAGKAREGRFEIDDVALVKTGKRGPSVIDEVVPRKKREWERKVGRAKSRRLVKARMSDWPSRLVVPAAELPAGGRPFLERLARDTWRGLDALTDRENGLPVDHVKLSKRSLEPPHSDVGDYTNITNVGLHMIALAAARELGLVDEAGAVARLEKLFDTLERLDHHEGFFFNYYDTVTLERTSHFLSFVDSSWMTAGLMVTRQTFPALADRATKLIERADYDFFYDEIARQMSHGYYVNVPTRSEYHYGILYTESRLGSLVAIGKGDVPEEHWYALARAFPKESDWQTMPPKGWRTDAVRGHSVDHGWYEWKGERYVPSWGGSMFEALMPTLVLDEGRYAPRSLGRNGEVHARVQRRFATEDLGYPIWGLSPSVKVSGNGYGEYGVRVLGALGYDAGPVAPYAAALALLVEPEAATENLRRIAERFPSYGEYGFYDSVDPRSGKIAHQYLALDQSMVLIAAADALRPDCIQERFAADPIAEKMLPILAAEDFFDSGGPSGARSLGEPSSSDATRAPATATAYATEP